MSAASSLVSIPNLIRWIDNRGCSFLQFNQITSIPPTIGKLLGGPASWLDDWPFSLLL